MISWETINTVQQTEENYNYNTSLLNCTIRIFTLSGFLWRNCKIIFKTKKIHENKLKELVKELIADCVVLRCGLKSKWFCNYLEIGQFSEQLKWCNIACSRSKTGQTVRTSQVFPLYISGQVQWKVPKPSMQVPPFLQGWESHSFSSNWQNWPEKPCRQRQKKRFIPSTHVPLLRHDLWGDRDWMNKHFVEYFHATPSLKWNDKLNWSAHIHIINTENIRVGTIWDVAFTVDSIKARRALAGVAIHIVFTETSIPAGGANAFVHLLLTTLSIETSSALAQETSHSIHASAPVTAWIWRRGGNWDYKVKKVRHWLFKIWICQCLPGCGSMWLWKWHLLELQSSMLVWQLTPLYPGWHSQ